jgi:hypothetical protein
VLITCCLVACGQGEKQESIAKVEAVEGFDVAANLKRYAKVRLTTNAMNNLSMKQQRMIKVLVEVGEMMDDFFWYEAYGNRDSLLALIDDPGLAEFVKINYGPWDRLNGDKPFIKGVGEKPLGANFYPTDMTKEDFEKNRFHDKDGLYSFVRRDVSGNYKAVPYHVMFKDSIQQLASKLRFAAQLAEDEDFKKYLNLRADAVMNDKYQESDLAWMSMKNNPVDVVVGPIETYEDKLYGYRAAHECYVLVKDMEWSARLAKYANFLPELQRNLPVEDKYKQEKPGSDSELNAYDVVYYAGDCNAGSKTIAINLPNDEEVQLQKGTRRLQLKNAMRAKFDKIMLPIASELIVEDQRSHVTFDAFFSNTMFHEVAHGLGIKNTIDGSGTVRQALKEHASALEEGKADILGLFMIKQLHDRGEIEGDLKDYYVTFMTGIFRSVRFGASSAHGKANMIRFNFFKEYGAFTRDESTGLYSVNFEKLEEATDALTQLILSLQGEGDYNGVAELVKEKAVIKAQLQADLDRLAEKGIPEDIVFEQGASVLGI